MFSLRAAAGSQLINASMHGLLRFLSSTLLPFLFWGLLIKTECYEKGYPYCLGVTQEPSYSILRCQGFPGIGRELEVQRPFKGLM